MELISVPDSIDASDQSTIEVVRDPERRSGVPILAGTRLAVHDIVSHVQRNGGSIQRVVEDFPYLTTGQVEAVMAWYQDHREEVDSILCRRRDDYVRIRAQSRAAP
jgi:uncharacterized protein (DUF433 family)